MNMLHRGYRFDTIAPTQQSNTVMQDYFRPSSTLSSLAPKVLVLLGLLLTVLLPNSNIVLAQDAAKADAVVRPLSNSNVKGFAGAMRGLASWAKVKDGKVGRAQLPADEDKSEYMAQLSSAWGYSEEVRREAEGVVRKNGFESLDDFQSVAERIMTVYAAIEVEKVMPEQGDAMSALMEGLAANAGLSAEQKAQMQNSLDAAKQQMAAYQEDISPADRKVIESNRSLLEKLFEDLREM